jgi:hypothetical protein
MVKLASLRPAFIDPDKIGALPSLVVLVSIASRGGGNIRWDAGTGTPAQFRWRLDGHGSVSCGRSSLALVIADATLCPFDDN